MESAYNYGLHRWRSARISDIELVRWLRKVAEGAPESWLPRYLLAQVHLERGDCEGAKAELSHIGNDDATREEVVAVFQNLKQFARPSRFVRAFEGHTGEVNSVSLSADGQYALSGSDDETLKLWEVGSGRCLRTFEGHLYAVTSVSVSADGQYALSGSLDKTLKLWAMATGRCLRTFGGHTEAVTSACLSSDGKYALSGSRDETLKLWEVTSGRCLRTFEVHTGWVKSICLSTDGQYALSGSDSGDVKLWEVVSGRCLRTFEKHSNRVNSACLSADGEYALSGSGAGSEDGTLTLWEVASGRCLRTLGEDPISHMRSICVSADGRYVLSGNRNNLNLWEVGTFGFLAKLRFSQGIDTAEAAQAAAKFHASLSTARQQLAAGDAVGASRSLRVAREQAGYERAELALREQAALYKRLRKRSLINLWRMWGNSRVIVAAASVCMSGDNEYALSVSWDRTLKLWEAASGRCLRTFEGHTGPVNSVCLSADGQYALSGGGASEWVGNGGPYSELVSDDKTLKLWEVANGRCLRTFEGHAESVKCICMSADGQYALSVTGESAPWMWEVASGRCLRRLQKCWQAPKSISLSTDGQHVLFGGSSTTEACFLEWELEENEPADWDEGARPYLDVFLRAHRRYAGQLPKGREPTDKEITHVLTRQDRPVWTDSDFQSLLYTLGCAGYGWLRPQGVRRELERMTAEWKDGE